MDEGSGYCGSGGGIENVSDAAKIANLVMIWLERDEICLEKGSVESNMKQRFLADRLGIMSLVVGREREGYRGRPIRRNSVLEGLRVR